MGKLDNMIRAFKPQRLFQCSHTKIEVDGVLVRVPEDGDKTSWIPIYVDERNISHYAVHVEDIVQDPRIVRSARVSTGRDTKEVDEKADGMVNFLWRDRHVTPFEGVTLCLRLDTPIMYAQPFFRLFASHNEFSGRYSKIDTPYYMPENIDGMARGQFYEAEEEAQGLYIRLLSMGVAKEMARLVHLYRFHTKFFMTVSLRHVMEFLSLRNVKTRHKDTEFWEVREPLTKLVRCWFPWAFRAYKDYPNRLDFGWIPETLRDEKNLRIKSLTHSEFCGVLNKGCMKLLESFGNEDLALLCLDDFPNPMRAFGHLGMTFYIDMPIHVFRQWVRHRYGHWTELSIDFDRIVKDDMFFVPERFRKQEGKQGHYIYVDMNDEENGKVLDLYNHHIRTCKRRYELLRSYSTPPDLAAMCLPYSFYIPAVWTSSAEGFMNFLSLRHDSHAQKEIQQYAKPGWKIFSRVFPKSAKIFAQHLYYGDSEEIKNYLQGLR